MRHYIVFLLLSFSWLSSACETVQTDTPEHDSGPDCVQASRWQVGLAVGAGIRTNPLFNGDHIPLIILPDVAWYGEQAYFDNGELGYQFLDTVRWGAEVYINFDRERANFSVWQPSNLFMPELGFATDTPGLTPSGGATEDAASTPVSIDEIASRDWALHAGVQVRWYAGPHQIRANLEEDISHTHKGNRVAISYRYATEWRDWQIAVSPSIVWKSNRLVNYYYGLNSRDGVPRNQQYVARGGWQPGLSLRISRPITKRWQWLFFSSYQRLHGGMRNSPLVRSSNVRSIFFGAGYTF